MKYFIIIVMFFIVASTDAQKCMPFDEAERLNLYDIVNKEYSNAYNSDSTIGVFDNKTESFNEEWLRLYGKLCELFEKENLKWEKSTFCFNKIYFAKDGSIDFWFYDFHAEDSVNLDLINSYNKLIIGLSSNYKMKLESDNKYSQCASVVFKGYCLE